MEDRDPQTFAIIGAAMEVHRELGSGFLEAVYQEALAFELEERRIPFLREAPLPVVYKGRRLGAPYKADFLCYGEVIVEIKTAERLAAERLAQVLHYLKTSELHRALLINFQSRSLEFKRIVRDL